MSFLIAVHVNEGIVLAGDRRTTYSSVYKTADTIVNNIGVHVTNSTNKVFLCPNGAGISCCGDAALNHKPIAGYIQEMIRVRIHETTDIEDMPQLINDFFGVISPKPNLTFFVAGYTGSQIKIKQKIYKINVAHGKITEIDATAQGASWEGETLTLSRLLQPVAIKDPAGGYHELPDEKILWEYFTLQDAVDFARYAVETTIKTMRFKNVVETVGGNVDILIITPEKSYWLNKTELS